MKTCVLVLLAGCNFVGSGVPGSGTPKTETRPASGFTSVAVSGALSVEVGTAGAAGVELSGDDNVLPLIRTEVEGDRLTVASRGSFRPKVPLVIRVTAPQLAELAVSGASKAVLHGVHGDSLKIDLGGASKLRADGAVGRLTVEVSGASNAELDDLAAERVTATVEGASDADIAVSKALDAHVSGASRLRYRGDPAELEQDVTGASNLEKR